MTAENHQIVHVKLGSQVFHIRLLRAGEIFLGSNSNSFPTTFNLFSSFPNTKFLVLEFYALPHQVDFHKRFYLEHSPISIGKCWVLKMILNQPLSKKILKLMKISHLGDEIKQITHKNASLHIINRT